MRKHYPLDPTTGAENQALLPWSDGIPQTGTPGSYPGQALVTDSEAEILNAQAAAGLSQSGTDDTQLAQAISIGFYIGVVGGTSNALTGSLPAGTAIPVLLKGMKFHGVIGPNTNTTAATLSVSGFVTATGLVPIARGDGSAIQAGDLQPNAGASWWFDGAALRLTGLVPSDILALIQANTLTLLRINVTVYVRPDGSDASTDGRSDTAASAFKTPQGAYKAATQLYLLSGFKVTIQLSQTYATQVLGSAQPVSYPGLVANNVGVSGSIVLNGDPASPQNYIILPIAASGGLVGVASQIQTLSVYGVTIPITSATQTKALAIYTGGAINFGSIVFACSVNSPLSILVNIDPGGLCYSDGNVSVSGGGTIGSAINTNPFGYYGGCATANLTTFSVNNMTFANAFYTSNDGGATLTGTTFTGAGNTGPSYGLNGGYLNPVVPIASLPGSGTGSNVGGTIVGDPGTPWTPFTPNASATSGALSGVSNSGRYIKVGKIVFVEMSIAIINNGTGAGLIQVSNMPFAAKASSPLGGTEAGSTRKALSSVFAAGSTTLQVTFADGSYPAAAGYILTINGSYEAA